jgi:hypothetical protein
MSLLEPPNCPNCGQPVKAADLRRIWQQSNFWGERERGVECPSCHTVLKVRKWRTYALRVPVYVGLVAGMVALGKYLPATAADSGMFLTIVFGGGVLLAYRHWAPLLSHLTQK